MTTADAITNQYQSFHVSNLSRLLHREEGRGPYLVTQDGSVPGDPRMRACSFVLTRRGTWLHFYLYLALPESVRRQIAHFESVAEVMQRAESLPAAVVVEDADSLQCMIHEAGFEPAAEDAVGRALLEEVRKRHQTGDHRG